MKTAPLTPFFEPVFRLWFTMLAIMWLGSPLFAQTGPNYAGQVVNDASAGNLAWTNLSNAIGSVDDDSHASTPTMATNDESNYLKATDFGFTIPAFHAINGVEVEIEWHRTGANIRDIEVFLVVGGLIQTLQNNASNTRIPNGPPDGVDTYGGSTDLWGLPLADTDVEDVGFGVAVRVRRQGTGGGAPPHQPMVDRISITVYHKLDDKDPTNELNTNLTLSGTTLELTDAGGTLTQDLSTLNDALQAEIDQNKLDIAANSAAITANDAAITALQSDVATNTADIAINSIAIGANTTDIANNTAAITANDADITALQSDVATNTADIANSSTAIGTNTTDIANNIAAISANDADITALQSDVAMNTADIANNSTSIGANTTGIANNTAAISANDADITALQSDVATNTGDIANNSTAIGTNATDITNNTAAISANDTDITALQSDVSTNTADIANNTAATTANDADISALQSDVATNTADIANNSTAIATNTTDIANNTASITTNNADIIALQSDVATNITNIANNSTAIATNATDIANNTASITANNADITALQSDVATNITNIANNSTAIATNASAIAADTDGDSGNELNTSLTLNGTDLELTDAGGLLSVDLSSLSTSAIQDEIADADGNTRIQVEASPNEDIIRFEVGGTERWIMTGNRLEPSDIWNTFIGHQAGSSTTTGQQNTFLGKEAGRDNTTGETNVFLGEQAGKSNTSGWANTITGKDAGTFIQTGHRNAYYGYGSGAQNISGADNTMLGYLAGVNSTGSRNVFLGNQAGHSETGDDKLYIDNSSTSTPLIWGDFASDILRVNGTLNINNAYSFPTSDGAVDQVLSTNGAGNLTWKTIDPATIKDADNDTKIQVEESSDEDVIRFDVGGTERWVMTGTRLEPSDVWNTFIGHTAGSSNTTGTQNTFIGKNAGASNSTGIRNTFLGGFAGNSNSSGNENTFIGLSAGNLNQTGKSNTYTGFAAGAQNVTGSFNTFIGHRAGALNTGHGNIFLGHLAGYNESGDHKLYIDNSNTSTPLIYGDFATNYLSVNGIFNINNAYSFPSSDGAADQILSTNGAGNLTWKTIDPAIINDGDNDTKIQVEESSDEDVIRFDVGGAERWIMTGNRLEPSDIWNTFIGHQAGSSTTTGQQNTFLGKEAGRDNTTGETNVFLGEQAGKSNTSGWANTITGKDAGTFITTGHRNAYYGYGSGAQNISGADNTMLGYLAGVNSTGSRNVFVGNQAGHSETGDDKLYIDNSSTSTPLIWGDFASDLLKVHGTLNVNDAYNFPTADGSIGQVLASDGAGNLNWQTTELGAINDADNDTKIHVEKNTDEDIIRFDLGGVERWQMQGTRLIPINSWKSTFVGAASGKNDIGNTNNTFFGYETGFMNTSGADNTFVGREAGRNNDVGTYNVFLGSRAGISNVDANENTYLGYGAGALSTNGSENTSVGFLAGNQNLTGIQNTIVGNEAGYLNTGSANVFLGYQVGYNETGSDKLYIDNSSTSTPLIWGDFASNVLRVNGTFNINNAYSFPTSDGLANQILTTDGSGTVSWQSLGNDELRDADNDTKIQLEATLDEDIIRFSVGGTEHWRMEGTRLTSLNTGGSVFIGNQAGMNDDLATNVNVFIGEESGKSNTAGDHNTFIGSRSGELNTVGSFNTMLGSFAGAEHSNGAANTYVGANAGRRNSNGVGNTFVGSQAMFNNVYGTHNTVLGNNAGINATGNRNVLIGNSVGPVGAVDDQLYIDNTNTTSPLIWGDFASDILKIHGTLNVNDAYNLPTTDGLTGQVLQTDGAGNASWQIPNVNDADSDPTNEFLTGATLIGTNLEISDAGGTHVVDLITLTAGGNSSAIFDSDGDTRIQTEANPNEDIIHYEIAGTERWKMVGSRIEPVNSGRSVFLGEHAGLSDDLSNNSNVFVGYWAGQASTTGENNVYVGPFAGTFSTTGINNTSVGFQSGVSIIGGSFNTSLGHSANILPGFDISNSTAIGANAQNTADFQVRIGDASITSIGGFANWSNLSDSRLKKDIQDSGIGLDFIMKLRPVSYHLDMDAISSRLNTPEERRDVEAEQVKANLLQTGFLAQEVEQAAKELGYDFSGVDAPKNDKDFYGLRYAEFVVPLVKGMQEQQVQIETLERENADLRTRLESIEEALIQLGAGEARSSQKFQRDPEQMTLHQNVPNPFDRQTRISYQLPGAGKVQLSIYTQQNALVQTLVSEHQEAGEYTVEWNADSYSAGVYLYVLRQNGQQLAKRMMVLK